MLRPLAVDRTRIDCALLFARDAVAAPTSTRRDAGDLWDLVNRQDWAICESVQRGMSSRAYTHGWFAPMEDDSADIRRWLLPRLASRRADELSSVRLRRRRARRARQRRGRTTWPGAALACSGSSSSSSATTAAPPTTPAGSCGTATTRPAYVRLTQEAYDDWARLERESGEPLVTVVGGLDLFPPDPAIPMDDYTASLDEVGIGYELLDVAEIGRALAAVLRCRPGPSGCYQERGAIVPAGRGTAAMQELAATASAPSCASTSPVRRARDLGAAASRSTDGGDDVRRRRVVVVRRRLDQRGARRPRTCTCR